ncbi:RNA polymerase sigma factor [Saccharicrinis aurantiacus]|uniref:RNA polymerase sigma factor n=1 Tax=Saccharicrinis aurantiacus TaxID=1849719 RepID=UPI00083842EB|nr:RNA polymerase sigma factor [Saccharicrinis aurantiacus]
MNPKEDNLLIEEIKSGKVEAYSALVDKYKRMAYTLALSITKHSEDAEEVAQDAFVKAYKNLNTFKGKSKFSTWLYQIIYRTALSKVRIKKHFNQNIDDLNEIDINLDSYQIDHLERFDKKKIIKIAISKLKEDEAFILVLYYYQELSIEEISKTTELSSSNVKVKLHRARKNMLAILQKLMNGKAQSLIQA